MDISGVASAADQALTEGKGKNNLNQEDFLRLLMKELSYQDPLNPMDSKEFTSQLTQFSSLEELGNINKSLEAVLDSQELSQNANAATLIGKSVNVDGNMVYLDGTAEMEFKLADEALDTKIYIADARGEIVRIDDLGLQHAGAGSYIWNGKDGNGNDLSKGVYGFEIQAYNRDGDLVDNITEGKGRVTGVSFNNGIASLVLDQSREVYLSDVKVIEE
jgi:flagellar basal-body rod modification protein FlgD